VTLLALLGCVTEGVAPRPEPVGPTPEWYDPDPVAPPEVLPAAALPEGLVLNEVMADNESTVMTAALEFADWVELYNGGDTAVDLARVGVAEDEGDDGWVGEGTLLPGERVHLWATGVLGADTLPFALAGAGDTVVLTWDGVVLDRIRTGPVGSDTSWARFPDGGAWEITARPTPYAPNGNTPSASRDPSDAVFDLDRVHPIDVTLPDAALDSLRGAPYTQVIGSLGYEGAWFPEVGVAIKGVYGSLRSVDAKVALKLDVNDYADHELRGLEHLTLNNMVQDPSGVHEAVGYQFLREQGIPAPRTGWARLSLNGEDRGFYLLVEAVDERFLARWFDDPTGQLWEGAYGVDLQDDELAAFQYDAGPKLPDYAQLEAVSDILAGTNDNAAIAALEAIVDLDEWLAVMAFEAVAYHWDGYSTANNYRIYEDPTGRIVMIPWGLDQTWVDAYFGPWDGYGLVFQFCVQNRDCRTRYDEILIDMTHAVDAADLPGRVTDLLPLVRPELETDAFREYDMGTHAAYVDATLATMRDYPAQVRAAAEADIP
jgi:hypothetical protein